MTWNQRYKQAYESYHARQYPTSTRDFGVPMVKYPAVSKANGLTMMVCNFLKWEGHNAKRINVSGRLIDSPQKQQSGISLQTKKWIPSSTRRGAADVSSTIKIKSGFGISVQWEIKIGSDRPSEYQLAEQAKEQAAGGYYYFIHTPEQFFILYDFILNL